MKCGVLRSVVILTGAFSVVGDADASISHTPPTMVCDGTRKPAPTMTAGKPKTLASKMVGTFGQSMPVVMSLMVMLIVGRSTGETYDLPRRGVASKHIKTKMCGKAGVRSWPYCGGEI
ncbi:hypothetical protein AB1Y20_002254 [Prymnesium parvum]|uniref:Secreted protein n=1 Tax=Prymnesium parvum TaxID=97485 RepID=A0AB34J8V8_PRYPA